MIAHQYRPDLADAPHIYIGNFRWHSEINHTRVAEDSRYMRHVKHLSALYLYRVY